MRIPTESWSSLEDFDVILNGISVGKLFEKYEEIGFIYPAKKELLGPHWPAINQHWKKLVEEGENLFWLLVNKDHGCSENFVSVSFFRQNNHCMMAQHLVSSGNPFLSLKVLLAAQFIAEHHYDETEIKASQNWFRPNNRYAYRIFASMTKKLGPEYSSLKRFQYLHLPIEAIPHIDPYGFVIEEVKGVDQELIDFVGDQYGKVFVQAEELNEADIQLKTLGERYRELGLERVRKVLKIKAPRSKKILACILANRAPIGINFSLLENRAYYIIDHEVDIDLRYLLLHTMNSTLRPFYQDFSAKAIPIVTDALSADLLLDYHANLIREYMQSIWLREGFPLWFEHINSFYSKIKDRYKPS